MGGEHVETRSEEFARLVSEYETGKGGEQQEAWNLIADFAVENAGFIRDALLDYAASPPPPSGSAWGVKVSLDICDGLLESLQEGLMTDAGLSKLDRHAMRAQIDAIDIVKEQISALNPITENPATTGSSKWGSRFPSSCCTSYEDCCHDGVCHDQALCEIKGADDDAS